MGDGRMREMGGQAMCAVGLTLMRACSQTSGKGTKGHMCTYETRGPGACCRHWWVVAMVEEEEKKETRCGSTILSLQRGNVLVRFRIITTTTTTIVFDCH
jgi:hypothetical protein